MGKVISYHFRVDEDVLNNIKVFADEDGRLVNKEIECILNQYAIERAFGDSNVLGVRNRIADISNVKKKK